MKPLFAMVLLSVTLVGCLSGTTQGANPTPPMTQLPTISQTPLPTATPEATQTDTPTVDPVATLNAEATVDSYKSLCNADYQAYSVEQYPIWPNGEWVATGCESGENLDLILHNQGDLKWVLHFVDFVDPDHGFERSALWPLAWSGDGRFFYFTKQLSYSGGGTQCFPGLGVYGLYRLHLKTGTVVTLIPTNDFNGREITFSPTTEYYAVNLHGVTITNLVNGAVTTIDVRGVQEMMWSPDGRYLAFSFARCGEFLVESSTISVWDSVTKETRDLFTTDKMLLVPRSWVDSLTLEFTGEQWVDRDTLITIFEYDLGEDEMIFSATATPRP